jgi:transcriptional regulator with XRE-family HTH domain
VSSAGRPGPSIDRSKLSTLGKYFHSAMKLANMSEAELARQAGISTSVISRLLKGEKSVKDETLLRLCDLMRTPQWLEELIMNAAGYASRAQKQAAEDEQRIDQADQRVEAEIHQRRKNQAP